MPLIKCPMCEKEISPNAQFCPNCGEPMNSVKIDDVDDKFPNLPLDLSIGKQIVNWGYDAAVSGFYQNNGTIEDNIPEGKISVLLHQHGIKICGRFFMEILNLHNSQIENITEISQNELKDKSTIGRAVLGGVLLGGLGAIIGGMSGIGTKNVKRYYLIINYWDIKSKSLKSISIGCDSSSKRFIDRFNRQKNQ